MKARERNASHRVWQFRLENRAHRIKSWRVRLENGGQWVKNVTHTLELRSIRVALSSARLVYHARRLMVASVRVEMRSVRLECWPVSVNSDGSDAMINRAGTRIRPSASSVGEAASGVVCSRAASDVRLRESLRRRAVIRMREAV